MLVLFTDSDSDISLKEANELGYKLISMPYTIGEKTIYPYKDFEDFNSKEFYDTLRSGVVPTTSALSPGDYIEYFEPYLLNGDDILYVHFSCVMSGTFNSLHLAMEELLKKYPDRRIELIDAKGITILFYNIATTIARLHQDGKNLDELLEWAKEEVDHYAVYFYADNLTFFGKSGRVSGIAAKAGNIIGLKPIIHMNQDGYMVSVDKVRGRKKALQRLVDYVKELQLDIKQHQVVIGHADCLELAELLYSMLKEELGDDLQVKFIVVNPTAGSHCGPDTIGVTFHAIHR